MVPLVSFCLSIEWNEMYLIIFPLYSLHVNVGVQKLSVFISMYIFSGLYIFPSFTCSCLDYFTGRQQHRFGGKGKHFSLVVKWKHQAGIDCGGMFIFWLGRRTTHVVEYGLIAAL